MRFKSHWKIKQTIPFRLKCYVRIPTELKNIFRKKIHVSRVYLLRTLTYSRSKYNIYNMVLGDNGNKLFLAYTFNHTLSSVPR